MKKIILSLSLLFLFTHFISAQEFKFKNEFEIRDLNMGISSNGYKRFYTTFSYRRSLTEQLSLQAELAMGIVSYDISNGAKTSFNLYGYGLGLAYFFKPSHNGLYATSMIKREGYTNYSTNNQNTYAKLGLGYRVGVGDRFYLSGEFNGNYDFHKTVSFNPVLAVGIKF